MPDLKYLYRVLYIFSYKIYYQESNILIIAGSSMVTVAEWLE
jgi:hypothetical protein